MLGHSLGCGEVGVYSGGILQRTQLVPGLPGFAWNQHRSTGSDSDPTAYFDPFIDTS
jgi:hypothetical protein